MNSGGRWPVEMKVASLVAATEGWFEPKERKVTEGRWMVDPPAWASRVGSADQDRMARMGLRTAQL